MAKQFSQTSRLLSVLPELREGDTFFVPIAPSVVLQYAKAHGVIVKTESVLMIEDAKTPSPKVVKHTKITVC
jgi:hypothetical protein